MARLLFCVMLTSALMFSGPVFAHEGEQRQQVLLQVQREHSEALVLYEISAGQEAALLRSAFDVDHDSKLDDDERKALAFKVSQDALQGLALERDGVSLHNVALDWRLELGDDTDGAILLALMLRFDSGGAGRYTVALQAEPANRPGISVEGEAGDGLRVQAAIVAPESDGIATGKLILAPGDAIWFEVAEHALPK